MQAEAREIEGLQGAFLPQSDPFWLEHDPREGSIARRETASESGAVSVQVDACEKARRSAGKIVLMSFLSS